MALTAEDLQMLGQFIDQKLANAAPAASVTPADDPVTAARKEAEPWYYVHLADGRVIESQDSVSTYMDDMQVIGRYQKGK